MGKSGKRKKDKGHKGGKPAKKAKQDKSAKSSEPPELPPEPLGSPDSQQEEGEPHQRVYKTKPKYWVHNLPNCYSKSAASSLDGTRIIHTAQG